MPVGTDCSTVLKHDSRHSVVSVVLVTYHIIFGGASINAGLDLGVDVDFHFIRTRLVHHVERVRQPIPRRLRR